MRSFTSLASGFPDAARSGVRFSGLIVALGLAAPAPAQDGGQAPRQVYRERVIAPWPSVDEPPRANLHAGADTAVVVGAENYQDLPSVPYARRDARAFATWLLIDRGLPAGAVRRLEDPTRGELELALREAGRRLGPGGTLWVYFAGQGLVGEQEGAVLLPVDADTPDEGVPLTTLDTLADGLGGRRVIALVDASFGGRTRTGRTIARRATDPPPPLPQDAVDPEARSPHLVLWTAARPGEVAGALEPTQHGLFTYHALGALFGWADGALGERDGRVTLAEAQAFVADRIAALGRRQTPSRDARDGARSLVLAKALRSTPSWKDLDPGPPPLPPTKDAVTDDTRVALVLEDTPRTRRTLGALGDRVEVAPLPGDRKGRVLATTDADLAVQLLPPGARDEVRPLDDAALAEERAWAREEIERQVQAKADREWASAIGRLRAGDPSGLDAVRAFANRWAELSYPWVGGDIVVSARQALAARRLVEAAATAGPEVPTASFAPATFPLGAAPGTPGRGADETLHTVQLTRPYALALREVDAALWALISAAELDPAEPGLPAVGMAWADAAAACNVLSALHGLTPAYALDGRTVRPVPGADGWRLPTEAEWSHAAGPGPFLDGRTRDAVCAVANVGDGNAGPATDPLGRFGCDDGYTDLAPVGALAAGAHGLFDLGGNAAEWVFDAWTAFTADRAVDPAPEAPARLRVVKGGSFRSGPSDLRPSAREALAADQGRDDVGLRLARTLPASEMRKVPPGSPSR